MCIIKGPYAMIVEYKRKKIDNMFEAIIFLTINRLQKFQVCVNESLCL